MAGLQELHVMVDPFSAIPSSESRFLETMRSIENLKRFDVIVPWVAKDGFRDKINRPFRLIRKPLQQ